MQDSHDSQDIFHNTLCDSLRGLHRNFLLHYIQLCHKSTFIWPLWPGNFAKKSSFPPSCYDNDARSGAASQAASVASEVCVADIPAVVAENGNVIDELGGDEVKQRRVSIASIDRARTQILIIPSRVSVRKKKAEKVWSPS